MKFTLSANFNCNGNAFRKGEAVEVLPTQGLELVLKKKGIEFVVGPVIFNYLNEVDHPTVDIWMSWQHSQICESPTGHLVYVDETGPDGFHSWFKYLDGL